MKSRQVLFVLILCLFSLTGCSSSVDIENKAYVVALGIDER